MKRYQIHANYTGAFPIGFPFAFEDLVQAKFTAAKLNELRKTLPEWNKLKPFQVWDTKTGIFKAGDI